MHILFVPVPAYITYWTGLFSIHFGLRW